MTGRGPDDDPYVYPGTAVLRNKLGITDAVALEQAELRFALKGERQMQPLSPDERGLRDAHLLLFGRLYDWAGELRTCELAKERSLFCRARFIQQSLDKTFRDLAGERNLVGLRRRAFVERLAHYHGELNAVHPFREGNGRALRVWMQHLAHAAGHELTLSGFDREAWLQASRDGMKGDARPMVNLLQVALRRSRP